MTKHLALRFSSPAAAACAAKRLREIGVRRLEIFGPFPTEEVEEALSTRPSRIPFFALLFGAIGLVGAYGLQYWTAVLQYPINVGGRPLHSWPAFIPVTFELTVLSASFAIVIAFLASNRLPRLHHPAFSLPEFERASDDMFFVSIQEEEAMLTSEEFRRLVDGCGAEKVVYVPN